MSRIEKAYECDMCGRLERGDPMFRIGSKGYGPFDVCEECGWTAVGCRGGDTREMMKRLVTRASFYIEPIPEKKSPQGDPTDLTSVVCRRCRGTGREGEDEGNCITCQGSGEIDEDDLLAATGGPIGGCPPEGVPLPSPQPRAFSMFGQHDRKEDEERADDLSNRNE